MTALEITGVALVPAHADWVEGFNLEAPEAGMPSTGAALPVRGWILPRTACDVTIEVRHGSAVVRRLPAAEARPDVSQELDVGAARAHGFSGFVGAVGLPAECDLAVCAVADGGLEATLGFVRLKRARLESSFRAGIQPLVVTMLGRTGSTWLMHLLRQHPTIVVHDSQHYETRALSYWMHVYKMLSEPENQPYGDEPSGHFHLTEDPTFGRWFGDRHLKDAATFCQTSVESLYLELLPRDEHRETRYFAEKCGADHVPRIARELYPDAREVFLVRDFRDIFCSILAINRKRGSLDFGRSFVDSDEEYLRFLGGHARLLLESWSEREAGSFLLRYEDLILDPVTTLGRLLEYLDLDARASVVGRMLRRGARVDAELEWHRTTPTTAASIGRWRQDLDDALAAAADDAFGDALAAFGYAGSTGPEARTRSDGASARALARSRPGR